MEGLAALPVRELKKIVQEHGLWHPGIVEKGELTKLAAQAFAAEEAADGIEMVGQRTREERDTEGRANAVRLDDSPGTSPASKRQRTTTHEPKVKAESSAAAAATREEPGVGSAGEREEATAARHAHAAARQEDRDRADAVARSQEEATAARARLQEERARQEAVDKSKAEAAAARERAKEVRERAEAVEASRAAAARERQERQERKASKEPEPKPPPPPSRTVFTFGRHVGRTFADVAKWDPGYVRWALEQPRPYGQMALFIAYVQRSQPPEQPPPRTPSATGSGSSGSSNINDADVDMLTAIPGIGTKLAHHIVNERRRRDFASYEDASARVCGLGAGKVKLLQYKFPRCVQRK